MLNRIGAVVTVTVYILILRSAEVLEALKNVNLILAVHQINWTFLKCRLKLHIVREAGTLFLGKKCILELLDIVILGTIVSYDLSVQHEEDFIKGICRQITHRPAEQVILCRQENLSDLCQRQFVFVI